MKKVFITLLVLIATASICNAQILWKVSGNGLNKPSFLMGTHHIAPISILDSIPQFHDALNACDAVYGEVSQSEMNSAETQQKAMYLAMAPADSTLDKIFTPAQYDSIDAIIKKYAGATASIDMFKMVKPTIVNVQIAVLQSLKAFPDFNPQQQLDSYVQILADSLGKENGYFETIDFQLNLLYGDPISQQAEDLLKTIRFDEKAVQASLQIAGAYRQQNIDKMVEIMKDTDLGFDEQSKKRMIDDRNDAWVKALQLLMPDKSIFVCVGAGHLPGENGLINLLRQLGYTVTPL